MKVPITIGASMIHVDGDITVQELARIFNASGFWLVSDRLGNMVARRVPDFLRVDQKTNVVRLPAKVRAAK